MAITMGKQRLNTQSLNIAAQRANPTDLANLDTARSQFGYTPELSSIPSSYEKILNPASISNYSGVIKQSGTSNLFGILKKGINSDNLTGNSKINIPEPDTTNPTDSYLASINSAIKSGNDYVTQQMKSYDTGITEAQNKLSAPTTGLREKLLAKLSELGGKPTALVEEQQKLGVPENIKKIQELNTQIASVQAKYNTASEALSGGTGASTIIAGKRGQIARQAAVELGGLATMQQALTGNVDLAKQTALDTVNLTYAPVEQQIASLQQQIEWAKEDLTSAEKKKADAMSLALQDRQAMIDQAKTERTNILNIGINAAQNGAPLSVLNSINSATDLQDAIGKAGTWIKKAPEIKETTDAEGNKILYVFNQSTGQYERQKEAPVTTNVTSATAEQLASAIKQVESGGNYDLKGASGEIGAYQFMPNTWAQYSADYLKGNNLPEQTLMMSPENQDAVATYKINEWLNQGLTPQQVAAKWNSGSEFGWENKKGVNDKGVAYDVPAYVNKVNNALGQVVKQQGSVKEYNRYGLLANTDFNTNDDIDKTAKLYLDTYLKNSGSMPTAYQLGLGRSTGAASKFAKAQARAQDLYYQATGSSLPDANILGATKKLVATNNQILNKNIILADTIKKNFDLAIKGEISGDVNKNATILNRLLNPIKIALGDTATVQALLSNGTIQQEFANIISIRNAGGTLAADKIMAEDLIPFGTSVEAQKALVKRLEAEAVNIHDSLVKQNSDLYKIIDPLETSKENPNRQSKVNQDYLTKVLPK